MKMNVIVDLEEFYPDGDDTLSTAVISAIEEGVIKKLKKEFGDKIEDEFYKRITEKFILEKDRKVEEILTKLFEGEKIRKSSYGNEMVTFADYITEKIERDLNSSSFDAKIKSISDRVSLTAFEDLKKRYDVYFAAQIIEKLASARMLAQGVAESILKQ